MEIELTGLTFHAYHGVYPSEHIIGGTYVVDLVLHTDLEAACESDCLDDTVDYGAVCHSVREEMSQSSALIEHVAARIARRILHDFPTVEGVDIRLSKQNPPIDGIELASANVRGTFRRS